MKKIILILTFLFSSFVLYSQSVFRCVMAELYLYNKDSKEWVLNTKLSDLKIDITIEEEYISFHAKSPTMYKVYNSDKEEIKTKLLAGYRYAAKDLKTNEFVKIDILKSNESNVGVISVINLERGINFRYFIEVSD